MYTVYVNIVYIDREIMNDWPEALLPGTIQPVHSKIPVQLVLFLQDRFAISQSAALRICCWLSERLSSFLKNNYRYVLEGVRVKKEIKLSSRLRSHVVITVFKQFVKD